MKPYANILKDKWWNHGTSEICVGPAFDFTYIRLFMTTLISSHEIRNHCKVKLGCGKGKTGAHNSSMSTWMMPYFWLICSSWLTDIYWEIYIYIYRERQIHWILKSWWSETPITSILPPEVYFCSTSFSDKMLWAAVCPKLHINSLTRGHTAFPKWSAGHQQSVTRQSKLFTIS